MRSLWFFGSDLVNDLLILLYLGLFWFISIFSVRLRAFRKPSCLHNHHQQQNNISGNNGYDITVNNNNGTCVCLKCRISECSAASSRNLTSKPEVESRIATLKSLNIEWSLIHSECAVVVTDDMSSMLRSMHRNSCICVMSDFITFSK